MTLRTVTIFGGSGFVGRQLVQALARRGVVVRVATRDVKRVLHMKTSGAVGQVVPMRCNPTDAASVAGAVAGADAVINLIGILYERGKNTFQRMHVDVPEMIARAAAQAGIQHMVHISALGADANATSRYAQSKAMGEAALRAAHPDAVILRPSIIFGPEDDFFNRFARMCSWSPALPLIGGGKNKFQPVYVGDVVSAILTVLDNPITHGQTYELGGPAIYSFEQLLNYIMQQTGRKRMLCPLNYDIANIIAGVMQIFPRPMITRDQILQLKKDNLVGGRAQNLQSLGIIPTAMEAIVPAYLAAYRVGGRFAEMAQA